MRKSSLVGNLMLAFAALIWGCAFVAQSVGMDYMGPFTFQTVRSLVGAASLLPLIVYRRHRARKAGGRVKLAPAQRRTLLLAGLLCGLVVAVGTNLQQYGLQFTTAGKAGFLTALYILLVPLAGYFMGKPPRPLLWLCIALAALGLYLLSVQEGFSIGLGDLLLILCAIVFTGHILLVDHFAPKVPGVELCSLQFLVSALVSAIPMLLFETPRWADILRGWLPILYAGLLSSGLGYSLQILGQRRTTPTMASLLMSLESVFAVLCGMLVLKQMLSAREAVGCVMMFTAILWAQWVQLPPKAVAANVDAGA